MPNCRTDVGCNDYDVSIFFISWYIEDIEYGFGHINENQENGYWEAMF